MLVKIDVQGKLAAGGDLMQAAVAPRRICNKPLDVGNLL
jgi:hypothetical protein